MCIVYICTYFSPLDGQVGNIDGCFGAGASLKETKGENF